MFEGGRLKRPRPKLGCSVTGEEEYIMLYVK
jgi:hypothetical protein